MFKKMINRLIGKKEVSNTVQPLVFKDNLAAFEYACSYLETKILMKSPLPAIIIPGPDGDQPYSTQSGVQRAILRVCSDDGGFTVIAESASANGPKLQIGDLVAWMPVHQIEELKGQVDDPRFAIVGFILGTLHPVLSSNGWKGKEAFRK